MPCVRYLAVSVIGGTEQHSKTAQASTRIFQAGMLAVVRASTTVSPAHKCSNHPFVRQHRQTCHTAHVAKESIGITTLTLAIMCSNSCTVFYRSAMSTDMRPTNDGPWAIASTASISSMYSDNCVFTAWRCLPTCNAFGSTFPTTPTGYRVGNPTWSINANLLQISCGVGYEGRATVECPGSNGNTGGMFAAPTGCTTCADNSVMCSCTMTQGCTSGSLIFNAATTVGNDEATCCIVPTPITDDNIVAAVRACQHESPDFDCFVSAQEFGWIAEWDVSQITSLESLFSGAQHFDVDLSLWDVSNVQSLRESA